MGDDVQTVKRFIKRVVPLNIRKPSTNELVTIKVYLGDGIETVIYQVKRKVKRA